MTPSLAAQLVREYAGQGDHRTATQADAASAHWFAALAADAAPDVQLEGFPIDRLDVIDAHVAVDGHVFPAEPVFDAPGTPVEGIDGPLATSPADGTVTLTHAPMSGPALELDAARRAGPAAVIAVGGIGDTPGGRDAPSFEHPWGPPTVLVAPSAGEVLEDAASAGRRARVVVTSERCVAEGYNVVASVSGARPELKRIVLVAPRSGWGGVAGRGGGLVVWLAALRALAQDPPARGVHFVATSGAELGGLGLLDFLDRRQELAAEAHLWVHLGAGLAAPGSARLRVHATGVDIARRASRLLDQHVGAHITRGLSDDEPGESEPTELMDQGGRLLALWGDADPLQLPTDDADGAVAPERLAAAADAITQVVREFAHA